MSNPLHPIHAAFIITYCILCLLLLFFCGQMLWHHFMG